MGVVIAALLLSGLAISLLCLALRPLFTRLEVDGRQDDAA